MSTTSRSDLSRQFAERRIIRLKAEMKNRHNAQAAPDHRSPESGDPTRIENDAEELATDSA